MKIDKFKEELAHMSESELYEVLENTRRELFSLKLNASTAHIKDYSLFNKLRKNVARIITVLRKNNQKVN